MTKRTKTNRSGPRAPKAAKPSYKFDVITPPNVLKVKVGGHSGAVFHDDAVARAEAGLKALATNFAAWLESDVGRLEDAFEAFARSGDAGVKASLHHAAHDLKGEAGTLGLPLLGRVAGALADLLARGTPAPTDLVARHVALIGTFGRGGAAAEREGLATLEALAAETAAFVAKS